TDETDAPTPPVIASSTAPDSRNSTLYRTVSRARTLRRGSTRRPGRLAPGAIIVASCALIIASRVARSRRPGARLPWAALPSRPPGCPAGPNNGITAGVRPVLGPLPYNRHMDTTIEVSSLRKRFGRTLALDGMTFTVLPGQVTGFVGPNGAGKS